MHTHGFKLLRRDIDLLTNASSGVLKKVLLTCAHQFKFLGLV